MSESIEIDDAALRRLRELLGGEGNITTDSVLSALRAPTLPTVPGFYANCCNDLWELGEDGWRGVSLVTGLATDPSLLPLRRLVALEPDVEPAVSGPRHVYVPGEQLVDVPRARQIATALWLAAEQVERETSGGAA